MFDLRTFQCTLQIIVRSAESEEESNAQEVEKPTKKETTTLKKTVDEKVAPILRAQALVGPLYIQLKRAQKSDDGADTLCQECIYMLIDIITESAVLEARAEVKGHPETIQGDLTIRTLSYIEKVVCDFICEKFLGLYPFISSTFERMASVRRDETKSDQVQIRKSQKIKQKIEALKESLEKQRFQARHKKKSQASQGDACAPEYLEQQRKERDPGIRHSKSCPTWLVEIKCSSDEEAITSSPKSKSEGDLSEVPESLIRGFHCRKGAR